jgi:hypothetical protein
MRLGRLLWSVFFRWPRLQEGRKPLHHLVGQVLSYASLCAWLFHLLAAVAAVAGLLRGQRPEVVAMVWGSLLLPTLGASLVAVVLRLQMLNTWINTWEAKQAASKAGPEARRTE